METAVEDKLTKPEVKVDKTESKEYREIWAEGFIACMHQFQIMSKAQRQNIHLHLKEHGPGYARRLKASKFRGFVS